MEDEREALPWNLADRHQQHRRTRFDHQEGKALILR